MVAGVIAGCHPHAAAASPLEEAMAKAATEDKPVLMDFYTDW